MLSIIALIAMLSRVWRKMEDNLLRLSRLDLDVQAILGSHHSVRVAWSIARVVHMCPG